MHCPACHQPGMIVDSTEGPSPRFACETPDCPVQTFDPEGAQSVEAPGTPRAVAASPVEGDQGGP